MSSERDIEGAIYENAASDGQFAIAYALLKCAFWLKYLGTGDAAGTMGAVEFLATKVEEVAKAIDRREE